MSFLFINKNLRLNNLKTRAAMNAKISVFVICVEAIMYLLLHNLHDCTFNLNYHIDKFNLYLRLGNSNLVYMDIVCHNKQIFNKPLT